MIVDAEEFFEFAPGVLRAYVKPKHLDVQRLISMVLVTTGILQLLFIASGRCPCCSSCGSQAQVVEQLLFVEKLVVWAVLGQGC